MLTLRRAVSPFVRRSLDQLDAAARRVKARRATQSGSLAILLLLVLPARAAAAPGVAISPKTQTVNRAYGITNTETFAVTNTGTTSGSFTVTSTCSGVLTCTTGTLTNTLAAGQVWNVSINHYNEQVGTGTLTVTASTTGASDQAVTTVQIYAPGLTLTPTSTSVTQVPSSVQTGTFTLTNTGGGPLYYTTSVNCTGALTNCSVSPTVFSDVPAGAQRTFTATYTTGAAGTTGIFSLTAYTTGANKTATIDVTAGAGTAVSVTPKNGTGTLGPNTTGNNYTFTVTNTGSATTTYTLSGSCANAVTCSAYSNSVSLAAGATTTVPITYATTANNTGSNLSGTIKLKATAGSVADSAIYTVTVTPTPPAVAVTPKGSSTTLNTSVTGQSFTFTVANTSTSTAATSFALTGSCAGSVTCSAYSSSASLAGGQQTTVPIAFATTVTAGTGTIKLKAVGGGVSDSATYTVTVNAPATAGVTVTPKNTSVTWPSWTTPTQNYTVTNTGSASATFTIVKSCGGVFVTCTAQGGTSTQTIAAGASATIGFTYETHGPPPATDWVRLKASSGSVADSATTTVNAVAPGGTVAITPSSVTKPASGAQSSTFTVNNTGTATSTYALTVACTGALTACSVPAPTSVTINAGQSASVPVNYTTGAAGTSGTATLTASTPNITPNAVLTVTAATTNAVSVTPTAGSVSLNPGQSSSSAFTIKNVGSVEASYSYSVTCPSVVVNCSASSSTSTALTGSTGTLQPNATFAVTVSYQGGTTLSSGALTLGATDQSNGSVTGQGQYTVSVAGSSPITVTTTGINPGTTIARNQCLSISTGNGTAYECGDLRVVHPLPTTTTYGKARTPTLIYSSRTAKPSAVLLANVALQSAVTPTSIQAVVTFNNLLSPGTVYTTPTTTYTWQSGWSTGTARRISMEINALSFGAGLQTGAYKYTFQVSATQNGVMSTASDTGTFVIVNRVNSPFGAGWWLDGLEQLVGVDANRILWIGGDGSTRMYQRVFTGTGTMYAATEMIERPDSLISQTTCSVTCYYARLLPNKARVNFDAAGNHVQTVNALGHVTSFGWNGSGTLASITLPVPSGSAPSAVYGFQYTNDTSGVARLASVTAPTIPGEDRTTYVDAFRGVTDAIRYLAPNNQYADTVRFGYFGATSASAPAARLMSSRTNRRGHRTDFTYDAGDGLQSAKVNMALYSAGTDIVNNFASAETRGYVTPVRLDSTWTIWDGPRNVADTTKFLLNRFGAPDSLIGALNDTTRVTRDLVWPALAKAIERPRLPGQASGYTTRATYNARGLVVTAIEVNPLGDGVNDTTAYEWDATFDKPTKITSPMGDVVLMEYNPDGRMWTKTSGGVRVNFDYRQPPWFAPVCAGPTVVYYPNLTQDTLAYDWLCNLQWVKTPINPKTVYLRDGLGRVVATNSPIDSAWTAIRTDSTYYDPSDLVVRTKSFSVTRPDSVVAVNTYDKEGNLLAATQEAFPGIARRRGGTVVNGVWVENPLVGALTRSYSYDPAGRKQSESSGAGFGWSMAYDPAGNVLSGKDLGSVVRTYDAANRLSTQYGSDSSSFTYDKAGRMTAALNEHAQVRRGYYPNGSLKADTLRIVNPATPGSFPYEYVTSYGYDRNGRRASVTNHLGRSATYTYDPVTGNIRSITDVAGNLHRFTYDALARLDSIIRLSGRTDSVVQKNGYDVEGRLTSRYLVQPSTQVTPYYNETYSYDGRNKIVRVGSAQLSYTALGQLAYSNATNYSGGEEYETDGLGMHRWHTSLVHLSSNTSATDVSQDSVYYTPSTTSVGMNIAHKSLTRPDTTLSNYGELGNLISTETVTHNQWDPSQPMYNPVTGKLVASGYERVTVQGYNAENRMVLTDIYVDTVFAGDAISQRRYHATESYRYDALGRRIFVRSLKPVGCLGYDKNSGCHSFDNHTIWDGDQILSEVRLAPSGVTGVELNLSASGTHYGTIENTHAGVIDQPISVARNDGAVILPYPDWRGLIDKHTCAAGVCGAFSFPGSSASVYANYTQGTPNWYGSLTEAQTDASGFQYKRNRYYDSKSGTFTQDDPIGIAGGFNTYAYADGDPVSYSDPFGLCFEPVSGTVCALFALGEAAADLYAIYRGAQVLSRFMSSAGSVDFSKPINVWTLGRGKPSSAGKMQREVEKGQAPKSVDRVDRGNPSDPGDEQPQIEFKDGYTLKQDGTWKHNQGKGRPLTKPEKEWVEKHNWTLPN